MKKESVINLKERRQQKVDGLERKKDPHFIDDYIKSIRISIESFNSTHTYQETITLLEGIYSYIKFTVSYERGQQK